MTKSNDQQDSDARFDEANAWYFRLSAPDATKKDQQAFEAWLGLCPANRQAWDETKALMSALRSPARRVHRQIVNDARLRSGKRPRLLRRLPAAIGGLATIGLVLITAFQGPTLLQNATADYYTTVGERRVVDLPDGSSIELNTNSAIRLDFSGDERRLDLLRGEAFFVVGKRDDRPFVVTAADRDIHDIGTAFNVDLSAASSLIVEEGIVQVRGLNGKQGGTVVEAGQSLRWTASAEQVSSINDMPASLAWRNGQLIFTGKRLGEVVSELNRYYRGQFVIANPTIRDAVFSGVLDIGKREDMLSALKAIFDVTSVSITPYLVVMY